MIASKDLGNVVLDELQAERSKVYPIYSCRRVGDLSQHLDMCYADSFADQARATGGRFVVEFSKLHRCAVTYGYRGYSAGKTNGIVDIKPTDSVLLRDCERFLTSELIRKYGLSSNLKPVKVVAHVPNGNRFIGVLDRTQRNGRHVVVILGVSNYNGKPK